MHISALSDVVGQDSWSDQAMIFGKLGQLTVVGLSGTKTVSKHKMYVVHCTVCAADKELFGEGCFLTTKKDIDKNFHPCGCGHSPSWSQDQYSILCKRKAQDSGYEFKGFASEWLGNKTKLSLVCELHGEWCTGSIHNFIVNSTECPECNRDSISQSMRKDEVQVVESFFATGAFHPLTEFTRSDRKDSRGGRIYWNAYCPDCRYTGESQISNLQRGKRPCLCSKHRQTQGYINGIFCEDDMVAVKFGIANYAPRRQKEQNNKASYEVTPLLIYHFPDKQSCRSAELECKQVFTCGVIPKDGMPDGYTETTFIYNLDKIKQIYTSYGGVCTYNSEE